jgi:hypothetical protein
MRACQPVRFRGKPEADRPTSAEDCISGHRSKIQPGGVMAVSSLTMVRGAKSSHSRAATPGVTRTTYASTDAAPSSTVTATRARSLRSTSICMHAPLRLSSMSRISSSPNLAWESRTARSVDTRDPHRCSIPLYALALTSPSSVAGRRIVEEFSYERTPVRSPGGPAGRLRQAFRLTAAGVPIPRARRCRAHALLLNIR